MPSPSLWIGLVLVLGFACSSGSRQSQVPAPSEATKPVNTATPMKIYLMLSVDWEGDTLRDSNLKALREFNTDFPQYPVVHFINPAYYTKKDFMPAGAVSEKVRSVLKPNDETGLHVHAWENLIRAAGVEFRSGPSFWGPESLGRGGERGDDVPLNLYTEEELLAIFRFSLDTLEREGFDSIHSFRGGGWISGPKIYQALLKAGIDVDSSAVPPDLIAKLYPDTNLERFNRELWSNVSSFSCPDFQEGTDEKLIQFPNNIGLADYVDGKEFFDAYLRILENARDKGANALYLHYGWHQESAVEYFEHQKSGETKLVQAQFLQRVRDGLEMLEAHARQHEFEIVPVAFRDFPKARLGCP